MDHQHGQRLLLDTPATYRIRLQGFLDATWSSVLGNLTISVESATDRTPMTILTGRVADQAELIGALNNVYDLGYPILSVECLDY